MLPLFYLFTYTPVIFFFLFNKHSLLKNIYILNFAPYVSNLFTIYPTLCSNQTVYWSLNSNYGLVHLFSKANFIFLYNLHSTNNTTLGGGIVSQRSPHKLNAILPTVEDSKYFDILLRYAEFLLGIRVNFLVVRSPLKLLSKRDLLNILHLRIKLSFWLNNMSARSWVYVATIIIFFFKTKDAVMVTSWMHVAIRKLSLFSHSRFFYLLFIFFNMSFVYFQKEYRLLGIKIRVAGKISVTGNARKRSMVFKKGTTSSNNFQTRVTHDFYLVKTKTGCLGVTIYLYYE